MTSSNNEPVSKKKKSLKARKPASAEAADRKPSDMFLTNGRANEANKNTEADRSSNKLANLESPTEELKALVTLYKSGKFEDAVAGAEAMLAVFPNSSDILNLLGTANSVLHRYDLAIETYRRILKIDPKNALVYNNMGNAFRGKGDLETAIDCYQKALKINPSDVNSHNNLGVALTEVENFDDALKYLWKSLKIQPGNANTHCKIGTTLVKKGELDQAIQSFEKALEIDPNLLEAHNNMGVAFDSKGALKAAIASYDKTIAIDPLNVTAHFDKALLLLKLQDFKAGWPMYEYRWKKSKFNSVPIVTSRPKWRLGDQNRVLVWGEQGLGDEVMFASLIPDLYAACSHLIIRADKRLIPIFKRSFPADIEYYTNAETVSEKSHDAHIAAGSLPKYFRQTLASYEKAAQGYLSADKAKTAVLRDKLLGDEDEILIGLSWHSTSNRMFAQKRRIPLGQLATMFHATNVKFVSLQYGNVTAEINQVKKEHGIDVAQVAEIDNFHDIDGLAALISACDRIISIDNVTVHLAGALGKATDALLPRVNSWRWGLDPNNSYWYRSVRLRRQTEREDWGEVLAQFS